MTTVNGQKSVTILGSTGSIGTQTVDIVTGNPERWRVEALTVNRNVELAAEQALRTRPSLVVTADPDRYAALRDALSGTGIEVAAGSDAVVEAARRSSDIVVAGIVGAAGLAPVWAAIERGARIAFANKEVLVCAGELVTAETKRRGAELLPVDSEHSAIFQCFDFKRPGGIRRLLLTASGGPFRTRDRAFMATATPEQAVKHPKWNMGAKISIDSATMMNKGLEIIEARHLFDVTEERIDVVVHPQSVIHSMVEYVDGSVLAQLGSPDMRCPIAHALAWPERIETPAERLDLARLASLTFEAPDPVRFPALRLAREVLRTGGSAPTILNAANEIAVSAFLDHRVGFLDIERVVEETLSALPARRLERLDDVFGVDAEARRVASGRIARA